MTNKTFISADFNPANVAFDAVLTKARDAVVNVNVLVQDAAYSALYTFVNGYTTQNVQRLFNSLCVIDGSFDNFRYENLRQWMATYFSKAKEAGLIKGTPLSIKKEKEESTGVVTGVISDWVYTEEMGDNGKPVKKYTLPNHSGSQVDRENHAKMLALLASYASDCAVHTAAKDARNTRNKKEKSEADLNKPESVLAYEAAQKAKKLCASQPVKVKTAFEKAVQVITENGGDLSEMRIMLRNLLAMIDEAPVLQEPEAEQETVDVE